MSKPITAELIEAKALIVDAPTIPEADRSFQLPKGLFVATGALYFAFLGVMALGFSTPGLIVPLAICAVFVGMFFGVATVFVKADPAAADKMKSWGVFAREGIATNTGPMKASDAVVQMMILPVLILIWGFVVVTIAATV